MRWKDLPRLKATRYVIAPVIAAAAITGALWSIGPVARSGRAFAADASASTAATALTTAAAPLTKAAASSAAPAIVLTGTQRAAIKIAPAASHVFPVRVQTVGSIDFDEDMATQVYTPYQGRIVALFAKVGDDVQKGQTLFTIDSADLIQAESTLINAAGVLRLTSRALARAKELYGVKGLAQKDYDQAVSDQQGAEGNYKAAVDAVLIFGKTPAEIETIAATRRIDPILVVHSPISGRVTSRSAAPGLFVQPGNAPAPFTVVDISKMWMVGNVPETDSASVKVGQAVQVSVMAYPDQVYQGRLTTVGATVDPTLHTLAVRSEIEDPRHELRPGMFAQFVIETASPMSGTAVPVDGVVREGDGTMTVWVTSDRHTFTQRPVSIGRQHDGYDQILSGVRPGDLVVTDGAVFLDNMLTADPTD
jgi:cobalt-zinc-cadmium efflux system membrane fusion protein